MARKIKMYDGTQWVELIDNINNQTISGSKTFSNDAMFQGRVQFGNLTEIWRDSATGNLRFMSDDGYEGMFDTHGNFLCAGINSDVFSSDAASFSGEKPFTVAGKPLKLVCNDAWNGYNSVIEMTASYGDAILNCTTGNLLLYGQYNTSNPNSPNYYQKYAYTMVNWYPIVTGDVHNISIIHSSSSSSNKCNISFTLRANDCWSGKYTTLSMVVSFLWKSGHRSADTALLASGLVMNSNCIVRGVFVTASNASTLSVVVANASNLETTSYGIPTFGLTVHDMVNGQFGSIFNDY